MEYHPDMKAKSLRKVGARKKRTLAKAQSRQRKSTPVRAVAGAAAPAIPRRWAWHYRTLLALRDRLMQDAQRKRRDVADAIESHSMHLADSATDEFDHDLALAMLAREESAVTEINDAITRILENRYGHCEETGEKIPAARLRALPWCRFGREVEAELERAGTVTKFRLPGPGSVRGTKPTLPDTGRIPPETLMEGETVEEAGTEVPAAEVAPIEPEETEAAPAAAPKRKAGTRPARLVAFVRRR
jgi:RNA polymerase-binding transcription factor DksA